MFTQLKRFRAARAAAPFLVVAASLLLLAACAPAAFASPTRAGTAIVNQGHAVFSDMAGNAHEAVSNTVHTIVAAMAGVDITAGAVSVTPPGAAARFEHLVTNTGNSPDIFDVTVAGEAGYSIDYGFRRDSGTHSFTRLLEPGESELIYLVVEVPSSMPLSAVAGFTITAASRFDGAVIDEATDTVAVSEARPSVDVHDSPAHAYLGIEYTFKVSFGNSGDIPAAGAAMQCIIPAALEFVSADGPWAFDTATRTVTWALGSIMPGGGGTYSVRVRVVGAAPGITYVLNSAALTVDGGVALADQEPTGLVTSSPAHITITAVPSVIPADGWSTSLLTATVVDALGNPVPDGTPACFSTTLGSFAATGDTAYTTAVVGGQATAVLIAPLMSGFVPTANDVLVKAGAPETGEAQQVITVVFSPAGVTGIVLDIETGRPMAGLPVELRDAEGNVIYTAHTGSDGRYLLVAPATGSYIVTVTVPRGSGTCVIEMPVEVDYLRGMLFTTANALLGRVAEAARPGAGPRPGTPGTQALGERAGGHPLAGAEVSLYSSDGKLVGATVSDSEGGFRFLGLARDNYTLIARTADGRIGVLAVDMTEAGEITCGAIIWMYLPGVVYDALTRAPIPGAAATLVFASGPNAGHPVALLAHAGLEQANPIVTGADGNYIFYAAPGHYALRVSAFGYEEHVSESFVLENQVVNADVPMTRLTSIGLELAKTADRATAHPGAPIHFELAWRNTSSGDLANVVLTDELPPGLQPVAGSISGGGVYDAETHSITWNFALAPSEAGAVAVCFDASADASTRDGSLLLNRAEVRADGGSMAAAAASVLIARMPGITIIKETDCAAARTGDMVTYRVAIANSNETAEPMTAHAVAIRDEMPLGFTYVPGSSMLGSQTVSDPAIGAGGNVLVWMLGDIAPGDRRELVYKVAVDPAAAQGDGVNRAFVTGQGSNGYPFEVGPASAKVAITGPAFSQLGTIIGRVYVAAGEATGALRTGSQASGRNGRGIAGAELLMDDGTRVITDADGFYHVPAVAPGARSIKLNMADAGSPSQFVRVLPSGMARVDFPVAPASEAAASAVSASVSLPELVSIAGGERTEVAAVVTVSNRGAGPLEGAAVSLAAVLAQVEGSIKWLDEPVVRLGLVPAGESVDATVRLSVPGGAATNSLLLAAAVFKPGKVLAQANAVSVLAPPAARSMVMPGYAIVSPARQLLSYQGHIPVKVVTPIDENAELTVNGKAISADRVGTKTVDTGRGVTTLEYVSVGLNTGNNVIELVKDGAVIARADVLLPGAGEAAAVAAVPTGAQLAVGARIPVAALAVDAMNLPAGRMSSLDAEAAGASFLGADADPGRPGFQTVAGAQGARNMLLSVTDPDHKVTINAIVGESRCIVDLTPLLGAESPLVLAGSAELHLSAAGIASSYAMGRAYARKEFDDYVLTLGFDGAAGLGRGEGNGAAGGDGAYSLFGDGSAQGDAAPSQGMFYARIARGESYAMCGDFQSSFAGTELVNMRSNLTGFSAAGRLGQVSLSGFAAPTYDARFSERIQGNGSSGYYFLSRYPVAAGSDSVRIVITAHNDDSVIIEAKALARGIDYTIDYEAGAIMLASPLPSVHAAGGKVLLEVDYAAADEAQRSTVAGVRATVDAAGGALKLGASALIDAEIGGAGTRVAAGLDATARLGELGDAYAEVALSDGGEYAPPGAAARAGLKLHLGPLTLIASAASADGDFVRPGSSTALPRQTTVNAELSYDGDAQGVVASLNTDNTWAGANAEWTNTTSLKLGHELSWLPQLVVGGIGTVGRSEHGAGLIVDAFAEAAITKELSARATAQLFKTGIIQDADGDVTLGLTYETVRGVALTVGYSTAAAVETTSAGSGERRHSFVAALAMGAGVNGKVYSRLSMSAGGGGATGARTLTAGYSDTYSLAPGLKLLVAAEGTMPLGGAANQGSGQAAGPGSGEGAPARRMALSGTLDYTAPAGLHAVFKQEMTLTPSGRALLTQASAEGKLTPWLTLKGDVSAYSGTAPTREGLPLQIEGSVAAAARPLGRPVAGLAMITGKYYAGERFGRDEVTAVGIASADISCDVGSRLTLDGKIALKLVGEGARGEHLSASALLLLQASPSVHIGPSTDIEGFVRALGWGGGDGGAWRMGWSVQAVQTIAPGLRLGLGYNSADLADTDIADTKPWAEGFYVKAMLKF